MESLALLVSVLVVITVISGPLAVIFALNRMNFMGGVAGIIACLFGLHIFLNVVTSFRMIGLASMGLGLYAIYLIIKRSRLG